MGQRGYERHEDKTLYAVTGCVADPILGLVHARCSGWKNGAMHYSATCVFHGRAIDARANRTDGGGVLSHRALSRWVYAHAIPAMRSDAMQRDL